MAVLVGRPGAPYSWLGPLGSAPVASDLPGALWAQTGTFYVPRQKKLRIKEKECSKYQVLSGSGTRKPLHAAPPAVTPGGTVTMMLCTGAMAEPAEIAMIRAVLAFLGLQTPVHRVRYSAEKAVVEDSSWQAMRIIWS